MANSRRVAFLLEDFSLAGPPTVVGQPTPNPVRATPGLQLLDRLLSGYPYEGMFRPPRLQVVAAFSVLGAGEADLRKRSIRGLQIFSTAEAAVKAADDVVIVPRGVGAVAADELTRIALAEAPEQARIFVYGVLANTQEAALAFVRKAAARRQTLVAGTTLSTPWFLPPIEPVRDVPIKEALMVVQGAWPAGELFGAAGILPIVERRRGGETGLRSLRQLEGGGVWRAGKKGEWPAHLLAAALSRSHTPQGDAIKDGRTQDLFGLGLVSKLAINPRAWQWTHRDGLRVTVLVLDGVVADFNYALSLEDRTIFSAQIFRSPPPAEHHYGALAVTLEDFFTTGQRPWPQDRDLRIAQVLERMRSAAGRSGQWISL